MEPVSAQILRAADLPEDFLGRHRDYLPLFRRLLEQNLAVQEEKILILNDKGEPGRRIAPMLNALYAKAAEEMGLPVTVATQPVKTRGDTAAKQVLSALDAHPQGNVILLNVSGRLGNMDRLGKSYRTFCKERRHRFFSSSNWHLVPETRFSEVLQAFAADYRKLSREGARLKELLDPAEQVRVTTAAGTDVTFRKQGMKAINNDGFYTLPGMGGNMPAGEVYLPPVKRGVEGTIVIDGSYRTKDAGLIPVEPIIAEIERGDIVRLNDTPEAKALERTLRWAEARAKYPWGIRRVCELGIGLNPGAKLIGCTILDEKVRGTVHFAHGSNKWFGGDVSAIIHLDHVMKDPRIFIDGKEWKLRK